MRISLLIMAIFVFFKPGSELYAQTLKITYEDALQWEGGKYLSYTYAGDLPSEIVLELVDGAVWDFRNFPFPDTIETGIRHADSTEKQVDPTVTHIEEDCPLALGRSVDSDDRFAAAVQLSPEAKILRGYGEGYGQPGIPDPFENTNTNGDTLLQFPMTAGVTWKWKTKQDSVGHWEYGYVWVRRDVEIQGRIVLAGNDTLDALGVRTIGLYDRGYYRTGDDLHQSYAWYTREYGETAVIVVGTNFHHLPDTTSLRAGDTVDISETLLSVNFFSLRIPDDLGGMGARENNASVRMSVRPVDVETKGMAFNLLGQALPMEALDTREGRRLLWQRSRSVVAGIGSGGASIVALQR